MHHFADYCVRMACIFDNKKKPSVFTYQIQATNFNMESLANLIQKQLTNV